MRLARRRSKHSGNPSPPLPLSSRNEGALAMPVSTTSIVERIARVIAGRIVSINAEGDDPSAGDRVDACWRDYQEDARSILRTLREPDPIMAEAGDVEIWERMVLAALEREDA